ncbi:hypothetical protein R50073_40820 [Maricurvus nonylphenolicus]|uniref:hypothetical protein n=1 Tax=Maricurvus nonylphenolicus TaxID=1008307 RepID=UPI0036F449BB
MNTFTENNKSAFQALEILCCEFVGNDAVTENIFAEKAMSLLGEIERFTEEDIDEKHEFGEGLSYAIPYVSKRMVALIMFMKPGACIDAHDHHGFAGVMRLIRGEVKVENFSLSDFGQVCESGEFNIVPGKITVVAEDECSAILSGDSNIHQVTAGENGAIFFDIYAMTEDRGRSDFFEVLREEADGRRTVKIKASVAIPE